MWKLLVKNQKIEVLEREVLASDQIQYVKLKFTFDGAWKRFHKVVQFTQCDETFCMVLGYDGTSCYLPAELHVGAVKLSVFGYDTNSDTTVRATTIPITLNVRLSGFVEDDDDAPIPPTPDLYTQLLKKMEETTKGDPGKSAYELALEEGYEGTLDEWLESLHGKDGETPDLSEYAKTTEVTTLIQNEIAPLEEVSHSHSNKTELDLLTADLVTILQGLQQFEDATFHDIQTIKETLNPLLLQMHWHDNLELLNGITAERMKKWDADAGDITALETKVDTLQSNMMDYIQGLTHRCDMEDAKLINLQEQIDNLRDGGFLTLFQHGDDALTRYAPQIGIVLNGGYHLMNEFILLYPHFCCEENEYAISYNVTDFGWNLPVVTMCLTDISLTQHSQISMCYQSGSTENGELYLVAKPTQMIDIPLGLYIYNQIQANNMVSLPFQWLYSESDITTLTKCDGITTGHYYVAWVGRSNNSHPKIKSVKVLS